MVGRQPGFWDVEERLRQLSARDDPLEKLAATVDFQMFRPDLAAALGPRDPATGGRPAFDPVLKFRMQFEHTTPDTLTRAQLSEQEAIPEVFTRDPKRAGGIVLEGLVRRGRRRRRLDNLTKT